MNHLLLTGAAIAALGATALLGSAQAAGGVVHHLRPAPAFHPYPAQAPHYPALRPAPVAQPVFRGQPQYRPQPRAVVPAPRLAPQPVPVRPAYAQPGYVQPAYPQPYVQAAPPPVPYGAPAYPYPRNARTERPRHNNLVKVGVGGFFLQDSSSDIRGDLTPENLQVDVGDRTVLAGSYTRFIGDHFGVEIPLGAPVEFGISAAGPGEGPLSPLTESLSGQEIATVDALPLTAIANVYFTDREATVRPYVGLALNHTRFSNETADPALEAAILGDTTIELENSTNIGAFAGVNVRLTDNLHASLLGGFVNVDTTATITTDTVLQLTPEFGIPLGEFTREVDVELNPVIGLATLGFSF